MAGERGGEGSSDGKEPTRKEIPLGRAGSGDLLGAKASLWRGRGAGLPGDSCKDTSEAFSKHCGPGLG